MADFTPIQQQAISTLEGNLSVSAGAGSGKTRVLVERFLKIVESKTTDANAQQILAITFTRKAAREMLDRVQKGMLDRLRSAEKEEDRQYWQEQLLLTEHAGITTIDSFCSQVIRENPVEAGMDPNFQVQEEYLIRAFEENAVKQFVAREIRDNTPEIRELLHLYPAKKLEDMLLAILPRLKEIGEENDITAPYIVSREKETAAQIELEENVDALIADLPSAGPKGKEQIAFLQENREQLHQWIASGDYEKADALVHTVKPLGKICGKVQECRDAAKALLFLEQDKKALPQVRAWQGVLNRCRDYVETEQRNQELYSFGLISARAVEVLEQFPLVLQKYRERYRFIMVDEFQDTNEEQKKLVYLLSGGDGSHLKGNNLFIVGDAKQSIYRFRGADVSVFKTVQDAIEKTGGENLVMDDNFRSAPEIITACNTLFNDLLGGDEKDGKKDKKEIAAQPLKAHQPPAGLPVFAVLQQGNFSPDACQSAEARYAASAIEKIITDHPDLSYGDVAILLPAIHLADSYRQALEERGIKCQVSDGKGFYDRPEIVDVLNLFTVLFNTRKDWALAGFLRSPFAGLTDQEITDLVQQNPDGTLWDGLHQKLDEPFYTLAKKLDGLQNTALHLSLPELFDAMEEAFAVEPTLLRLRGGREKLANYRKLRMLASGDAMQSHSSPADFLKKMQQMRRLAARESGGRQELDPDAVQIMTIHKSKGLEFPAVVLPNLDKRDPVEGGGLLYQKEVGLGVKVPDAAGEMQPTSVYETIQEENAKLEDAEKIRQLYVAMTRAEKYLVLIHREKEDKNKNKPESEKKCPKKTSREKWGEALSRVFAPGGDHSGEVERVELDVGDLLAGDLLPQQQAPAPIHVDPAVYERTEPVAFPRKIVLSATALLTYDTCPRSFYYQYGETMPQVEPEPVGDGLYQVSPADLGTYVHKVLELLEHLPLEKALDRALSVLEYPRQEQAIFRREGKKLAEAYCASPLYKELADFPKEREKHFTLPLYEKGRDQVIFTGSMDLLVHLPDGNFGIVDYKTGHPPVDGKEKQGYRRQLLLYALAAEAQYPGRKTEWAALDFLRNTTRYLLENREEEEQKLHALLDHLLTLETEADFPVRTAACKYCPFAYFCPKK